MMLKAQRNVTQWRKSRQGLGATELQEILVARLTACVTVLETLVELNKVDARYHETILRVVRHGNDALELLGVSR